MSDLFTRTGVQSYCFRNFKDNQTVAKMVRDCGLQRIEVCAVHADFQKPETFDDVIGAYEDQGVKIGSIGVETLTGDETADRNRFDFAKKAGCECISIHFKPDTYEEARKVAAKLVDEYGIKVGIHNHGGYHWLGNSEMLGHVFQTNGDQIGLVCDTAWAIDARQNPVEMMEKFIDRLYGIHFKDFTYTTERKHIDVPIGEGILDLKAAVNMLNKHNYRGYAVYEYEGDPADPIPAVKQCVENMRVACG